MRGRRRLWIILLAVPLLLLAADTLYWGFAEGNLERGFAAWVAEQRSAGWTVDYQPPTRAGWPLAATLVVPAMSLSGPNPILPGPLAWNADRVVLRVSLLQPGLLRISAEGRQRLLAAGSEIPYAAERLRLTVPLGMTQWPQFADVDVENLRTDSAAGDASVGALQLHVDVRPEASSGEPALTFALRSEVVNPPTEMVRPFNAPITALSVEGSVTGPVPTGETAADRAGSWRDGGGAVEVSRAALHWGPLDLSATATLALDEQLQPMGAGSARMVGYAETLDALASHAAISRSAATAAKAVLSLLASAPDDGSAPDVEVPLTLQYRTLSMRQVPLVRLPELDWP